MFSLLLGGSGADPCFKAEIYLCGQPVGDAVIYLVVGLLSQLWIITIHLLVPNYTAWW